MIILQLTQPCTPNGYIKINDFIQSYVTNTIDKNDCIVLPDWIKLVGITDDENFIIKDTNGNILTDNTYITE